MAAPTPTARTTPTGFKMPDGFKTLVTLANLPGINLWEETVKPPGVDGGELIPTTTMHNNAWRTFFPRSLRTLDACTFNVFYDPDVYSDIIAQTNVNQVFTVRFPDNSTLAFWGALTKFEPSEHKEGEAPKAAVTIGITNADNSSVEQAPVFTPATGT